MFFLKHFLQKIAAMLVAALALSLCGCACSGGVSPSPSASASPTAVPETASPVPQADYALPEQLTLDGEGLPLAEIYRTDIGAVETMDLESYLMGVVAGEMHNDWPIEALKAQAIIARTFALRFITDGGSQYDGAQLSTDINEAQAYDLSAVNDAVRRAVEETRGQVILCQGEPIQAWFHAHAGGVTARAREGLNYNKPEPPYTKSIQVRESDKAPENVRSWTAEFSLDEVQAALDELGGGDASQLAIGQRGESGRVTTFTAGSGEVSAVDLRRALDSTRLKSTLLTDLAVENGVVRFSGAGYGHGVGMSQWGAYEMAAEGSTAEEIIQKFYQGVEIAQIYGK